MENTTYAGVYRFHDSVALYLRGHDTVYLSPVLARLMAAELLRFADDCEAGSFSRSTIGTVNLSDSDDDEEERPDRSCGLACNRRFHPAAECDCSRSDVEQMEDEEAHSDDWRAE